MQNLLVSNNASSSLHSIIDENHVFSPQAFNTVKKHFDSEYSLVDFQATEQVDSLLTELFNGFSDELSDFNKPLYSPDTKLLSLSHFEMNVAWSNSFEFEIGDSVPFYLHNDEEILARSGFLIGGIPSYIDDDVAILSLDLDNDFQFY